MATAFDEMLWERHDELSRKLSVAEAALLSIDSLDESCIVTKDKSALEMSIHLLRQELEKVSYWRNLLAGKEELVRDVRQLSNFPFLIAYNLENQ
jgi:hypothetical protein